MDKKKMVKSTVNSEGKLRSRTSRSREGGVNGDEQVENK